MKADELPTSAQNVGDGYGMVSMAILSERCSPTPSFQTTPKKSCAHELSHWPNPPRIWLPMENAPHPRRGGPWHPSIRRTAIVVACRCNSIGTVVEDDGENMKKKQAVQTEECCVCGGEGEVGDEVIPVWLKNLFDGYYKAWAHHGDCHRSLFIGPLEETTT